MQTPATREAERLADNKRRAREAEAARYRERADKAAGVAATLWDEGAADVQAPYLGRKSVQAHGVRSLADGTLLVPMRDVDGALQNLQRIAPAKPADGGTDKRFLPGGRKSGLMHVIGSMDAPVVLLLGEGYATCATLHEATGRTVVVCFDAGNLVHVARELRARHPLALLLLCADDDSATEARTGKNPGREKAVTAARVASEEGAPAGVVWPEGLPEGGTDWNDLAAHASLAAVRDQVEQAIAAPAIPKPQRGPKSAAGGSQAVEADPPQPDAPDDATTAWNDADPFHLVPERLDASPIDARCDKPGVWFYPRSREGERMRPVWLCAPLRITAMTRTEDGNGWGVLLEFEDPDRTRKAWAMPLALLSGEGAEWAARLRDMGLRMAPGTGTRNRIAQYLDTRRPVDRVTCTDRVGWHRGVYVMPTRAIGGAPGDAARYIFETDQGVDNTFRQAGELDTWRTHVAAPCTGNSRLVFAMCCAFGGPLMGLLGVPTGLFHLVGESSLGKTTALLVAASIWGSPVFKQQWRTTDNALEATAAQHSDCVLILDEISQADGRIVGECAYMLANEQEKGRSTRGNLLRRKRTWRLLGLSSGEKGLADYMAEAGKKTNEGQLLRMPSVPADAGAGLGMLEDLHGAADGKAFVECITKAAATHYGHAGLTWLECLAGQLESARDAAAKLMARFEAECVPTLAHPQVRRVATRFALVAAAGELATKAGLTDWPAGEALRGVRKCFEAWLAKRGHMGNGERHAMAAQVKAFLECNGDALFTALHRVTDDHRANTPLRVGFRRVVDQDGNPVKLDAAQEWIDRRSTETSGAQANVRWQYLCLPEAFKRQVCKGLDHEQVAKLLRDRGHLQTEGDRLATRQRILGMGDKVPVYLIKPSIFGDDFEDL